MSVYWQSRMLHACAVVNLSLGISWTCARKKDVSLIPWRHFLLLRLLSYGYRIAIQWLHDRIWESQTHHRFWGPISREGYIKVHSRHQNLAKPTRMVLSRLPLTMCISSNCKHVTGEACPVSVRWACPVRTTHRISQLSAKFYGTG